MKLTTTLTAIIALAASGALAEGKPTPQPKPQPIYVKPSATASAQAQAAALAAQQQAQAQKQRQAQKQAQGQQQTATGGSAAQKLDNAITIDSGGNISLNSNFVSAGTGNTIDMGAVGLFVSIPTKQTTLRNQLAILIMAGGNKRSALALVAAQDPVILAALVAGGQVVTKPGETTPRPKARPNTIRDGIGAEAVPMVATPDHLPQHKGANLARPFLGCEITGKRKLRVTVAPGADRGAAIAACKRFLGVE